MTDNAEMWVVYIMTVKKTHHMRAVCEQMEWEAMEKVNPGQQPLIQGGIASESAAELLARGTSGDCKPRLSRLR